METYQEACYKHAESQGLLPVLDGLHNLFREDVQLEQTGGFTMLVSVKAPQPSFPEAIIWISNDGTEDNPEYVVGFYETSDGDAISDGTYEYKYVDSLGALAEVVQAYRQGKREVQP